MNLPKIVALCICIGLLSIALVLYTRPMQTPTSDPSRSRTATVAKEPTAEASLLFSPATTLLRQQEEKTIAIMIQTGKQTISSAQLEIRYDPSKISVSAIRPGTFFQSPELPLNSHDRIRGRIDFGLALPASASPMSGSGMLAFLVVTRNPVATESASTEIDFLPKTSIRSNDISTSLLKTMNSARIELEAVPPLTITQ